MNPEFYETEAIAESVFCHLVAKPTQGKPDTKRIAKEAFGFAQDFIAVRNQRRQEAIKK